MSTWGRDNLLLPLLGHEVSIFFSFSYFMFMDSTSFTYGSIVVTPMVPSRRRLKKVA